MSRKITPEQLKKLHTLLSQAHQLDNKADLVLHFSGNRVTSSKELLYSEAVEFINHLDSHLNSRDPRVIAEEQKDKMIKKMLYIGYQMGYDQPREGQEHIERKALNKQNVEAWCMSKHCMIHKKLKEYSVDELTKVLSQFEQVYSSFKTAYQRNG